MANKKKETQKSQQQLSEEAAAERMRLLAEADEVKGEQLSFTPEGQFVKIREIPVTDTGNVDDPEKKFDIYYRNINRILKRSLPKGKQYKAARDYIYEEKNVILTRGKRKKSDGTRGGDGRMAYIIDAEEVLEMVAKWEKENGKMADLFNTLHSYNISKGYGKRF
ncbi:hypothetical protein ACX0G9_08015 [Flavitalea flava]